MHARLMFSAIILFSALSAPVYPLPVELKDQPAMAIADPSSLADPKLEEGLGALKKGDNASAEKAFRKAIELDPKISGGYIGMAEVSARTNKPKEVERWLQEGVKKIPDNGLLAITYGRWLATQGRMDEAETLLKKAAKLAPDSAESHLALGEIQLSTHKNYAQAEIHFLQALRIDGKLAGAHVGLARTYFAQGKHEEAQKQIATGISIAPRDPLPLLTAARIATAKGKVEDAHGYLQRAIEVAPQFSAPYLDKSDLYLLRNDVDNAIKTLRAATQTLKEPAPAWFRLGVAYQAAQRWDESEKAYLETVRLDPKVFGAYNNLAFMMAERKQKLDQALTWIDSAISIAPNNAALKDTKAWVLRAKGDLTSASRFGEQAQKLNPNDAAIAFHLGLIYHEQGKKKEAEQQLARGLKLNPNHKLAPTAQDLITPGKK